MSEQLHCWRVYYSQKQRGYTRNEFKRVIAPDVESAISTVKTMVTDFQMMTSVQHDGPIDAVYAAAAQEQSK